MTRLRDLLPGRLRKERARAVAILGPDALHELVAMEAGLQQARERLAIVARQRGLSRDSGAIPWVLLMGPKGSGKSTLLERAGLNLTALLSTQGGTQHSAFWLAADTVFLDAPGRYVASPQAHGEWLVLLESLRGRRGQSPRAVLLVVGLDDVISWSPEQRSREAGLLRERLNGLSQHLQVHLPVHLVFNKADRLDGFTEFCNGLTDGEKSDALGFSLDVEQLEGQQAGAVFDERFQALIAPIEERCSLRVGVTKTRSREEREAILCFPRELSRHRDALRTFIEVLFQASEHGERPRLSAVYLSSAGVPSVPLPGQRHGLAAELQLATPQRRVTEEARPYFLGGLFTRLLKEAHLAAHPSASRHRQLHLNQRLTAGAALVACLLLSWFLGARYRTGADWLRDLQAGIQSLHESPDSQGGAIRMIGFASIELELEREDQVLRLLHRAPSWIVGESKQIAAEILQRRIQRQWLLPMRSAIDRRLHRASQWRSGNPTAGGDFSEGYLALKAAFILKGRPCADASPTERREWIVAYLIGLWEEELDKRVAQKLHGSADETEAAPRNQLRRSLEFYFERVAPAQGHLPEIEFDEEALQKARETLASGQAAGQVTFNLIASNANLMIRRPQLHGELIADPGIAQVFTTPGCAKFFAKDARRGKEWWGCVLQIQRLPTPDDLERIYQQQFEQAWTDWLSGLSVRHEIRISKSDPSGTLESLQAALDKLGREQVGELGRLLSVVAKGDPITDAGGLDAARPSRKNSLFGCATSKVKGLVQKVGEIREPAVCTDARSIFAPLSQAPPSPTKQPDPEDLPAVAVQSAYKSYLAALSALQKQLSHLKDSTDRGSDALKLVMSTLQASGELHQLKAARADFIKSLGSKAPTGGLNQLLQGLESGVWRTLVPMAQGALEDQWTAEIHNRWSAIRYDRTHYDPKMCAKVMEFLDKDLADFARRNLLPFYRGKDLARCELHVLNAPFHEPLIALSTKVCNLSVALAASQTPCPDALPPGPPPPPPSPPRAIETHLPQTPGCSVSIDTIRLDDSQKIVECQNSTARCRELGEIKSSGSASLSIKWRSDPMPRPIYQAGSMALLLSQGRELSHSRIRFEVPASLAPGQCPGMSFDLIFPPQPKLPGPPPIVDPAARVGIPASLTR